MERAVQPLSLEAGQNRPFVYLLDGFGRQTALWQGVPPKGQHNHAGSGRFRIDGHQHDHAVVCALARLHILLITELIGGCLRFLPRGRAFPEHDSGRQAVIRQALRVVREFDSLVQLENPLGIVHAMEVAVLLGVDLVERLSDLAALTRIAGSGGLPARVGHRRRGSAGSWCGALRG